ncbi:hypothetical protein [Methanospirillum hungatei]|uniref:hypothetical protein n=1 Tax=Methanospirillum hungatei TaxID=2203 RepID=UPI0026ED9E8C|nr:hypothetical protein [Methanospirillum hungatei]MCA1915113.1 hypothetical protein [Methanospirillum hungatei]
MQSPDGSIRILEPVALAGRIIYPVVRTHAWIGDLGGMISLKPCALLIREDKAWFFVSIDDSAPDISSLFSLHINETKDR